LSATEDLSVPMTSGVPVAAGLSGVVEMKDVKHKVYFIAVYDVFHIHVAVFRVILQRLVFKDF